MASIHNPSSEDITAKIDLGDGQIVEIRRATLHVINPHRPRTVSGAGVTRPVDQAVELAMTLYQSNASSSQIDQLAADLGTANWDDGAIESLVGCSAEWMAEDPKRAYCLLSVTYALARRWGTFWKHALVASILGYLVLRVLKNPEQAVPIFQDLQMTARILSTYFGNTDRAQGLQQLAERGLEQAQAIIGQTEPALADSLTAVDQVWTAIILRSWRRTDDEFFAQAEAWAVGSFCAKDCRSQITSQAQERWIRLFQNDVSDSSQGEDAGGGVFLSAITLVDVLWSVEADEAALRLLERVSADWGSLSPLRQAVLAHRMALIHARQGQSELASNWLSRVRAQELESLALHSITAQGEQLLRSLAHAQVARLQRDPRASQHWARQAARQMQTLEAWNQIPSYRREDDLRALYAAMLVQVGRRHLIEQTTSRRLSFRRSVGKKEMPKR